MVFKMKQVQNYAEYRIKESNGIRQFEKDGTPILGDLIKHVKITAMTAKTLNNNSNNFGRVYLLCEGVKTTTETQELETERLQQNSLEKLRQQAKDLGITGAHLMKEETLIKKLKEANV